MSKLYVQATLKGSGERVISEFDKLKGIRKLSADVMGSAKAFPVWRPLSERHPISGEPCLVRRRSFIAGSEIAGMEVMKPKAGFEDSHNYQPDNFEPEAIIQAGRNGTWRAPDALTEGFVEGSTPGALYPIRRDPDHRRYVVLAYNDAQPEQSVVHWLDDANPGVRSSTSVGERAVRDDEDEEAWGEWDEDEAAGN